MMELFRLERHRLLKLTLIVSLLFRSLNFGFSLNDEGFSLLRFRDRVVNDPFGVLSNWNDDLGGANPCSWFGVNCSKGRVVALNLRNMCLGGTLAPDLANLAHLKSIILRNNSFYGTIPEKIGQMKKLKVLDLGFNNFGGPLPSDLKSSQLPTILLLDNNELLDTVSSKVEQLTLLPEAEQRSYTNRKAKTGNIAQIGVESHRKLLATEQENIDVPFPSSPFNLPPSVSPSLSPSPSPAPSPFQLPPTGPPVVSPSPSSVPSAVPNQPPPTPSTTLQAPAPLPVPSVRSTKNHTVLIATAVVGGSALIGIAVLLLWRCNKVATVRPWATGLSGQLQKAFVTGVPKLKRSELEAACEDFSNVIGSTSFGTIYKGTLSSGVEIAVASVAAPSAKEWSKHLESMFRKRIDMLSKVNHKNFVNLLGYCEEDVPFTRMIAFEYAPNGTLFEHLHIQEAEHLDWAMRMRIAMGMAYCLDYMHQLTPPISHKNLNSSSVNLTEDYAAKISDFGLCNDSSSNTEPTPESNVYSFGIILFEMLTGRIPYAGGDAIDDWALDFLRGENPMIELVDPTLDSFDADQLEAIGIIVRSCVNPDPKRRPKMRDVTSKLKEMTRISQDGATPKISPLWWAELEILSTEAS